MVADSRVSALAHWHKVTGRQIGTQRPSDLGGGHDLPALGERLVVLFDLIDRIKIVHHQAVRLPQAVRSAVTKEVQLLQASAVSEVETRNGIDRTATRRLCLQKIKCSGRQQRLAQRFDAIASLVPVRIIEKPEAFLGGGVERTRLFCLAFAREPIGKSRNRRERDEGLEARQFAREILDNLLDQEIAERNAAEPLLRVRDRIEYGRRRIGSGESTS